jgi:hypothetical protein
LPFPSVQRKLRLGSAISGAMRIGTFAKALRRCILPTSLQVFVRPEDKNERRTFKRLRQPMRYSEREAVAEGQKLRISLRI